MKSLDEIKKECENCRECPLWTSRKNIVFSGGCDGAKIVLIGEAPGEKEDLAGKPFIGMAGKILDRYLSLAGLTRERDLYITNIVKCRPPKNRKPKTSEKKACFHFLSSQIEVINPDLIILCGGTALETFVKGEKISDVHGKIIDIKIGAKNYKALPIYHPSPLCRVADKQNITVKDLRNVTNYNNRT